MEVVNKEVVRVLQPRHSVTKFQDRQKREHVVRDCGV